MLQAGYVFCHRCGHATQEAYYFNGQSNTWVQLRRKVTGKFVAVPYTPPYLVNAQAEADADTITRVRLSPTNERQVQGLQHQISVECYTAKTRTVLDFVRSCPFCVGQRAGWNAVMPLIPGLGDLPTYVIGVVGARTVGKSCWIHALSCPANVQRVNEQCGEDRFGYLLTSAHWANQQCSVLKPNELNELGKTRIMGIRERSDRGGRMVAQVLIMDFAGELFAEDHEEEFENSAARIFRGGEGYSGVDGVVFMTDPLPETDKYNLTTTFERTRGHYALLNNTPFCFVMNKADLLIENPPCRHINNNTQLPTLPLLTEHTFAEQTSKRYRKSVLQAQVALQTHLLKKRHPLVGVVAGETRCAGFLVKSTTLVKPTGPNAARQEPQLDFNDPINVMDPLLWLLNELDIFPIAD